MRFRASKTCSLVVFFSTDFPGPLFVRRLFHMSRLFCLHLFLISSSFGGSGGLCFVIGPFLGYFHLIFVYIYVCGCEPISNPNPTWLQAPLEAIKFLEYANV